MEVENQQNRVGNFDVLFTARASNESVRQSVGQYITYLVGWVGGSLFGQWVVGSVGLSVGRLVRLAASASQCRQTQANR